MLEVIFVREYSTTNHNVYPLHLSDFTEFEAASLVIPSEPSFFVRHPFDCKDKTQRNKQQKKRSWVTMVGYAPLTGVQPVRKHFKVNEAQIWQTTRMCLTDEQLAEQGLDMKSLKN